MAIRDSTRRNPLHHPPRAVVPAGREQTLLCAGLSFPFRSTSNIDLAAALLSRGRSAVAVLITEGTRMSMHACPHCGGPALKSARKLVLVPGLPVTCRCCGRRIGVSGLALLAAIPLVAGLLALRVVEGDLARVIAVIAGVAATGYIQWRHVPLVGR